MITTHQIRNVLRIYGDQLKKRSLIVQGNQTPAHRSADMVTISMDARRKQMVTEMSSQLISQITPLDHREESGEGKPPTCPSEAEGDPEG